jgi:hypothetical protein
LQLTLELEAAGRSPVGQKYDVRNNIRNCEPQENKKKIKKYGDLN